MDNKSNIPVILMRDIIIFPQMIAPIFAVREKTVTSIENALMTEHRHVILLTQKNSKEDDPPVENLYEIGVLAKVLQILKFPDGSIKTLIEGESRVKILKFNPKEELLLADYEVIDNVLEDNKELEALKQVALTNFNNYIQKVLKTSADNLVSITEIKEPSKFADIITTYLSIKIDEKQEILEKNNVYERLKLVIQYISRELELLKIEEQIQEKVDFKLGKTQKEFLLREKINAIKEEIGGTEGVDEVDELRNKVKEAVIPEKIKEILNKEINKLDRMTVYTAESSVIRTYIDTVLELPWNVKTEENIDIKKAKEILDEDHYGLKDAKERILEFLAVKKLSAQTPASIICFEGPPGVGKTSLARSLTRCLNRNFAQISLGGIHDESEIRGHRRTYIGAMPGRIIRAIQDAGSNNPIIVLDEIEKMLSSNMGDPTAAMLEVLDPAQNEHFTDHYIDLPFDLSDVFFVATANTTQNLFKPLKDRMEIIYLAGYTEDEKTQIAKTFLVPKQLKLNGIEEKQLKFEDVALKLIIENYTREAGVRELERCISKICRKMAIEILENKNFKENIKKEKLEKYLGVSKYLREEIEKHSRVGVVHGLAWTEVGGELLEIEASTMPGKGNLKLTGRLGEIMQESANTAFSYVRSQHEKLKLPDNLQEKFDVHIHAPDGATPKDGPSAGIALTTALISALTGRQTKGNIAMTGEITLLGNILPIGGLKEKAMAALRNDIKTIIIPKSNERHIKELPDNIKENIEFIPVSTMEEVLEIALIKPPTLFDAKDYKAPKNLFGKKHSA